MPNQTEAEKGARETIAREIGVLESSFKGQDQLSAAEIFELKRKFQRDVYESTAAQRASPARIR